MVLSGPKLYTNVCIFLSLVEESHLAGTIVAMVPVNACSSFVLQSPKFSFQILDAKKSSFQSYPYESQRSREVNGENTSAENTLQLC